MGYMIKELRMATGMTQKNFAKQFGIPVSTLRKWEQGESSPPVYLLRLLAMALPDTHSEWECIEGKEGQRFFYDQVQQTVTDPVGNAIRIKEDLAGVNRQNLVLYLEEMFADLYEIQEKFARDCRYDKEDDVIWTR